MSYRDGVVMDSEIMSSDIINKVKTERNADVEN